MSPKEEEHLAWRVCNGTTIFLDIANDRYFRLSSELDEDFQAKTLEKGAGYWRQPAYLPRPSAWREASTVFDLEHHSGFSLSGVAAALWIQRRVERRLAERGLQCVLREIGGIRTTDQMPTSNFEKLHSIIGAFEQARLLRTAADRCLPRSIALVTRLASAGIHSELVIGVRNEPFGAHCWAQHGAVVLNDTVEEVRRYEPILVV